MKSLNVSMEYWLFLYWKLIDFAYKYKLYFEFIKIKKQNNNKLSNWLDNVSGNKVKFLKPQIPKFLQIGSQ